MRPGHQKGPQEEASKPGAHADPDPGSMRQTWERVGVVANGGGNYGSYADAVFDTNLDSAIVTMDPALAKQRMHRAYQAIIEDAAGIWLYEIRFPVLVHKRFHVTGMRPDAWWADLADWSIPPNERIPRDRIGLAPAKDVAKR